MASAKKQFSMIAPGKAAYGGILRTTRRGRSCARPLSTRHSMHLVLRSSKAKGVYSFLKPRNAGRIKLIIQKFSYIYGVKILSLANVGNHLHLHIRLGNRFAYKPFIRSITGAIAMAVTGRNRWSRDFSSLMTKSRTGGSTAPILEGKFWDYRPFTRLIIGFRSFLNMNDYVHINQLEGQGVRRVAIQSMIDGSKKYRSG